MKFIYATDLHGNEKKYNDILHYAIKNKINIIHLGADLLPKSFNIIEHQRLFIDNFLRDYYEKAKKNKITLLSFFGNDDIYIHKKHFRKYGDLLDEKPVEIEGFVFRSYPYVCDHPFGLKTASKLDYKGWVQPFCSNCVDVTEKGIEHIENIDKWLLNRSTIEDDLKGEKYVSNLIMSFHCPPSNLNLDVCQNGLRVGSKSIYNWIKQEQPKLVLCGHIHESYRMSNVWKTSLNDTIIIQPGQDLLYRATFVVIEINKNINAKLINHA
ncbi:MAG: metallophosphoesterase [Candidatus Nanoarchaeia archaeon]|nr:metallophosphoesterase [Candidatus Nanoarchaeia archaeon]